jgi:hypothetical protein
MHGAEELPGWPKKDRERLTAHPLDLKGEHVLSQPVHIRSHSCASSATIPSQRASSTASVSRPTGTEPTVPSRVTDCCTQPPSNQSVETRTDTERAPRVRLESSCFPDYPRCCCRGRSESACAEPTLRIGVTIPLSNSGATDSTGLFVAAPAPSPGSWGVSAEIPSSRYEPQARIRCSNHRAPLLES